MRQDRARRARALLSRFLMLLALVLFSTQQGLAEGRPAQVASVAESTVEQAQGILSVQRHLWRGHLPDDDTPDMETPGSAGPTRLSDLVAAIAPATHLSLIPAAHRILPPVRGPPVA